MAPSVSRKTTDTELSCNQLEDRKSRQWKQNFGQVSTFFFFLLMPAICVQSLFGLPCCMIWTVVERKEKQQLGELVHFGVPKLITALQRPAPVRSVFHMTFFFKLLFKGNLCTPFTHITLPHPIGIFWIVVLHFFHSGLISWYKWCLITCKQQCVLPQLTYMGTLSRKHCSPGAQCSECFWVCYYQLEHVIE